MATLPRSVQKQVDAAEALLTAVNTPPEAAPPQAPSPEQGQAPTPSVAAPAPEAPAPAPTPAPTPNTDEAWERRYQSLQGKYNAEVPQLHRQVRDLGAKLQEATERMEQLAKRPEPPAKEEPVDTRDAEAFGADLVDMVQRQTQHVMGQIASRLDGIVSQFETRLATVEQTLKGTSSTVVATAEEVFMSKLKESVPDWQAINVDQRFLTWLAEVDPVYGVPRQAALTDASENMNVARVIAVFNAFKDQHQPQPTPVPKADPLEKQSSPRGAGSQAPVPTEKPIITQAQITTFYRDVSAGRYRGRQDEVAQLEQMINEALAEGRVR